MSMDCRIDDEGIEQVVESFSCSRRFDPLFSLEFIRKLLESNGVAR